MSEREKKNSSRYGGYRRRVRERLDGIVHRRRKRSDDFTLRGVARTANVLRDESERYYPKESAHSPWQAFLDGIFGNNPVLFNAIGVALVVGAATSVTNALILFGVTVTVMVVCELMASMVYRGAAGAVRLAAYVLTAALVLLAIANIAEETTSVQVNPLGIYFPLICVSGLITVRCESFAIYNKPLCAIADALGCGIGFGGVAIIVGAVREWLSQGTLAGIPLGSSQLYTSANLPFFVFLLLGLMCALARSLRAAHRRRMENGKSSSGEEWDNK